MRTAFGLWARCGEVRSCACPHEGAGTGWGGGKNLRGGPRGSPWRPCRGRELKGAGLQAGTCRFLGTSLGPRAAPRVPGAARGVPVLGACRWGRLTAARDSPCPGAGPPLPAMGWQLP